ncbi:Gfo/Idh/MocA family protein [Azospirillum halopraeferens]|uniref:Gfo/Idh/MocA family protein n=1 Tax=Azospirillum halopraeferens TaxID=34010 RepID=UPI000403CE84|nr:Gfo/Idh/MocA family oxidoreductase [Azospirillum halopraeferens]
MTACCLVVGQGSIGRRHRSVLTRLGCAVEAVSRRGGADCHPDLTTGLRAATPDCVVVATETADHAATLGALAVGGFAGRVLVEKPLFAVPAAVPVNRFAALAVAYQLRFHPVLQRLRDRLGGAPVLSAQFYVGQHLPDWRPGRDHRDSYSARAALGGGALRDLSHELDLADWLFGPWRRVAALGGTWGALGIDSDDTFSLLAEFAGCRAATFQLNYLDRRTRREIVLNTAEHTLCADLIAGTVAVDREPPERMTVDRDDAYAAMHRALLEGTGAADLCDVASALRTVALVDAAERAAHSGVWVANG